MPISYRGTLDVELGCSGMVFFLLFFIFVFIRSDENIAKYLYVILTNIPRIRRFILRCRLWAFLK